jgi:hypothetical protein
MHVAPAPVHRGKGIGAGQDKQPPATHAQVLAPEPHSWEHGGMTFELSAGPLEISEEQIQEAQPRVRALQIQRYEEIWERIHERIEEDKEGARPIDPRFLELGIRVLKEEAGLYRLGRQAAAVEEEEDATLTGTDRRDLIEDRLREIEQKNQEARDREQARHERPAES